MGNGGSLTEDYDFNSAQLSLAVTALLFVGGFRLAYVKAAGTEQEKTAIALSQWRNGLLPFCRPPIPMILPPSLTSPKRSTGWGKPGLVCRARCLNIGRCITIGSGPAETLMRSPGEMKYVTLNIGVISHLILCVFLYGQETAAYNGNVFALVYLHSSPFHTVFEIEN
jgi:hypothetical protein